MQPTILGDFVDDLSRSREPGGVRGEARRPGLARPRGRAGALARSILRPSAGEPKAGCASRRPPESLRPAPCEPPAPGQNRPAGLPVALARAVAPARHAAAAFLVVFAALLAVSTTAQAQTAGICGRTEQVRTAILGKISGVSNCANVTDAHLAAITIGTGTLNLHNKGITALAAGDFDGLTALTILVLDQNSLTTLPAGVFDELTALTALLLYGNSLSTLPANVFDGLTSLTRLHLYNNSLTTLPAGVFDELTALTALRLDGNDLTTLPAGVFDNLTSLTSLYLYDNSLTTLPAGVFDELTALGYLYLQANDLTTLPAGVFEELTALTILQLWGNDLTTLPAGVFDKLTALTELSLDRNSLSTLPAGVFDELTALEDLSLNDNSLTTLPAGVFEELTALRFLQLYRNPGAPFSPTAVALPDDGEVSFAGGDVTLDGSGSDGGPWGTNVTYSWAASGATVTFDDAASATPVVTIPALTAGTELTFTLTVTGRATNTSYGTDTATVTAVFDATAGICGRTEQVRDAIVALISGVTHCALVTDAHLAAITGPLNLSNKGITALAAGDFDGLTALTWLYLDSNDLTTLPAGVFDELTALTTLTLFVNSLTTLPAGVFDGLTALPELQLHQNSLTTLPAGVFDELTALTGLRLDHNSLSTLPAGVFDKLTALTALSLNNNSLTTLRAGVFDKLTALTERLDLNNNQLSTLPVGVFDELTALTRLSLGYNSLTTLPDGVFDELTALTTLYLYSNLGAPFSPTADALPDDGTVLDAGGTVTLDGSGSGGPWGTNVTYGWALTSPTSGVTVTFDDAASATPVVTIPALAAGTELTFTLTVTGRATDTSRGTAPDTDNATVTAVFDPTAGICGRTEQVRTAIVGLVSGVTHCALVTDAHLAAITGPLNLITKGITALAAGDFDGLTALTGLYLGGNDLSTLPANVFDKLTALEALGLNDNSLTTLPAGVFDKLTALTERLDLFGNSLSTLPAGVFDELTALTQLGLNDNSLTTLPAGVFDELTALRVLYLNDNSLTTLPDDVFEELTALTLLWLYDNPGAPFSPTADALPDDGTVPVAGGTVTLDGSGSGGPWGTNVTYSWAASGATVTFDDAASATPVVTIPALAMGTELTFTLTVTGRATNTFRGTAPDTDTATVTAVFDATAGICGRTEQVRDAIVALISGVTHCALVTDAHLAAITGPLNLSNKGITALAAGDFDGLTGVTTLYLFGNSLTTLPAGVFDELTALTRLYLDSNSLTTLPAGVFDGLTALTELQLHQNSLTTFPDDVFEELTALTLLYLDSNSLTTLPAGVFDGLTALTFLDLDSNSLTTLPAGVFDGLTALTFLDLNNNSLSTLPAGVFDELTALTTLSLFGNSLSTLPAGVFEELTALTELQLHQNSLTTLPAGVFDELTALTQLYLFDNSLSTLRAGVFEELTALTYLSLHINPGAPFSPTADALPDDVTVPVAGGTVTLDGSGSDGGPWGTNVTYSWAASGATVTFDDAASATPVVTIPALTMGTELTFTLTVTGRATDALYGTAPDTDTATVTATATNAAPAFTSSATFSAAENQTAAGTVEASDSDTGDSVTGYAIQGGADQSAFSIVETSGVLTFRSAPNFEDATDADASNTYEVVVRATSGTGARAKTADQTITVTVTDVDDEAPGVPAAPTVSSASVSSVTAAWAAPANAGPPITDYDYRYRVKSTAPGWTEVTNTTITALSATITGLAEDTEYEVQVRATNDEGTSGWSDPGSASTDANAAPAFTSSATFSAAENQTAAGTVEASDSDTGDSVTGYEIQGGADQSAFSIGAASGMLTFRSAPNFEDATDDDASNTYEVVVRATSGTGARAKTEDQTITVTVTDVDDEAPGVPAAPTVSSASVSSVTAAWAAPANAGPPITDYDYRYQVKSTAPGWTEVTNTTITALSATITGLAEDTEYEVQVRATNDEGTSGWSDPGSASTDANAAPAFTSSATFSAAENQTAAGTVEASDSDTGDSVTGYAIQGGADQSAFSIVETSGVLTFRSAPNFEDATDADASNTYEVVVRATSGTGARAKTADQTITVTVTDVDGEAPGVPAAPTVSSASVSSVTVTWAAPANAGPPITDYDYRYRVKSTPGWTEVTNTPITALGATIAGLAENTEYEVQVRATNAEGTGGWSDPPGSGSTDANAAPAFTTPATFDAAENQTAAGTVEASDSDAGDRVTGYAIQGGADASRFTIVEATGVLTFTSAPNFEAAADADTDNDYVVVVRATSGTGARAKTADQTITVTVTDVDGEAPGVPAAPTVSSASVSSVTAAWAAPANAGPPITDYDYRYQVKSTPGWTEVTNTTITALSATITGLADGTEYEVQVRATNDEGTSGWSDSGSASTDANAAPAFTSSATFDAAENQTAAGTVEASDSDAGDSVTGYAIQGGADQSAFSIGAASGVLTFRSAPNFEDATDDDTSNTYVVVVRATSGTGARAKTADQTITVTVTDVDGEAPGVPAAPTVSSASVSSVTAAWAAPANAGPPITDYDYRYRVKSTPGWTEVTNTTITALSATITGLADGTEYEVQVRATNDEGTGGWSDSGSASTDANAAPAFTSSATFDAAENQTAAGTVEASDSDAGDRVTGYAIQGGADASRFTIVEATGVLTFTSAPNFEAAADADTDNDYVVVVRATSGTGARAKTADQTITVTVTDVDGEAPGVPAAPTVSSASVSSVTAAWAAPANAGPPITDYDYRYRVKSTPGWTEVTNTTITALSATITGLADGTEYEVQVRATNAEGTSGWSDPPGSGATDANAAPATA